MNEILKTGRSWFIPILIVATVFCLGKQPARAQEREPQISLNQTAVLKYRINIIPAVAKETRSGEMPNFILGFLQSPVFFPEEGVVAETDEWGTLLDLFKIEAAATETLRLVADCDSGITTGLLPDYFLVFSYALPPGGRKVFCRLIESDSRSLTLSCEGVGRDIRTAIKNALTKIDEKLFLQAWRCQVESTDSRNRAIINRGRLDGVEIGLKLIGYPVSTVKTGGKELSKELKIMQTGKKSGLYEVVKTSANYAVLAKLEKASNLTKGDLLELPEVVIPKRDVQTRGRKAWQGIYRK